MVKTAEEIVPASGDGGNKGLKPGAIGLVSTIVIGVASTAPGYSLAASLGYVADSTGVQAVAVMLFAFVPMYFIASAYRSFNKVDPDCGTTFTWATRTFGPKVGWLGGWGIIVADLVVMPSLAGITGSYFFQLFGADGLAASKFWPTVVGVIFIMLMTWICVIGIELNAKTQVALLAAEVIILLIFSVAALIKVYSDPFPDSVKPSLSWLNPLAIDSPNGWVSAFIVGILSAIFMYWGWDTAVAVNEETDDSTKTPGKAAVMSTLILVANYVIVAVAAVAIRGPGFLSSDANIDDVLAAAGEAVLGSGFNKFLIIAVLTSAAASTQTTILPASRSALSMAVHKALPPEFAKTHPRYLTPTTATWVFGIFSCVWYVGLTLISDNVLQASILAVGLMIAFYFGLTGLSCAAYFSGHAFKSVKNFFNLFLAPLLGGGMLVGVFFKTLWDDRDASFNEVGSLFGVGLTTVVGLGLLVIGIPLMLACRGIDGGRFFRIKADPRNARPDPESGELAPALGTHAKEA